MSKEQKYESKNFIFTGMSDDDNEMVPIMADGGEEELTVGELPALLPILPLRNTVLFPGVVLPISVGRHKSLRLVREVYKRDGVLGTIAQLNSTTDDPEQRDLYPVGTVAKILKILEMPDGTTTVIIQGKQRYRLEQVVTDEPYMMARVTSLVDFTPQNSTPEFEAIVESLKDIAIKIAKYSANVPPDATFAVRNIENPVFLINFICSNANIKVEEKQSLLDLDDLRERGIQTISFLVRELQMLELKRDIQSKVKTDMDQQQREYMLHQQIKTIQDELGGNPVEKEVEELKERAKTKKWKPEVAEVFEKEISKLTRINPQAGDYSIQLNYVQTLLDLPWDEYSDDNFDMQHAEDVLNEDHYGLELVKERILEHLAVLKLKNDMKSPIICLYGPSGSWKNFVGKIHSSCVGAQLCPR